MDEQPLRIDDEIDEAIENPQVFEETASGKDAENIKEDSDSEIEQPELDAETALKLQLEECQAQADEYLDGWQRARAEFANARKRIEKQRAETYRNASADFSKRLLPVIDDFGRAVESVPHEIAENSWFEGITLVKKKIDTVLEDMNVEPIDAIGQPFDPNFHEALSLIEADGFESGTVVEELQTGYRIGDMVIRASLVNVAA